MSAVVLHAHNLSKRFRHQWIFRSFTRDLPVGRSCAIVGPNGSGKSTLLQALAGFLPPTHGTLHLTDGGERVGVDGLYRYLSLATPYQELIEEFTLQELVDFHVTFSPLQGLLDAQAFAERIYLQAAYRKPIKYFSSGMKQRLKLGLALYADTPLLLLDEPTTNLDARGIAWYQAQIAEQLPRRLVLIASNQPYEYDFCDEQIDITTLR